MLPLFQCCKQSFLISAPRGQTVPSLYLQQYRKTNKQTDYYPKKKENTKSSPISSEIVLQQKECCEKGFPMLELVIN